MLRHLSDSTQRPARVVVIGGQGFVGNAIKRALESDDVPVLAIGRGEIDLLSPRADEMLASRLRESDVVVTAAAIAPVKNSEMFFNNMILVRAMLRAFSRVRVTHVVNISSDAIYADSEEPLTEKSIKEPESLHGAMHQSREMLFRSELQLPIAMVRPTLIYGADDPHNGYGPNRFRRLAAKKEAIVLFGNGEERRDHVYIDDVSELTKRIIYRRSVGDLNVATGCVYSFRDIAERIVQLSGNPIAIQSSPRIGPMPHRGFRAFDNAACKIAFPDFQFTPLDVGLSRVASQERINAGEDLEHGTRQPA